jgi:hypothetical protein
MSVLSFTAVASQSICPQIPSKAQRTKHTQSLSIVLRGLGSGLFFSMLVFFPMLALAADVTLGWDPNTEADLEGYGVYFKEDDPGPPYNFFGYVSLQELDDPDNPMFTLTGLQGGSRYYITLSAYDTAGNESGYADPVCAEIGDQILPCASADTGGGAGTGTGGTGTVGSSGGGSGGGAGCFIETALTHPKPYTTIVALLFFSAVFFMGHRMWSHKKVFNK